MVRFSPNAGYHGSPTITFRAWDQSTGTAGNYADAGASGGTTAFSSDSDTASLKVNKSPAATDEIVSTGQDISVTITVLANDTDDDGDSLSVHEITQNPSFGSVSINSDNTITYTPAYSYHGPDRFMYTVKDNFGGFDTAVVDITVTETFGSYINTSNAADAGIEPGTAEAVQLDEGPSPEEVAEEAAFDMNAEAEEAADDVFYGTGEDPVLAVASVDTKIEILENRNNQEFIRLAVMSREDQMAAQYGLGKNSQIIKYGAVEIAKEMSLPQDTYERLAEQLDDINRPGASVFDRAEPIVPEPEATLPSVPSLESGEEGAATGTESGTDAEAGRIIAAQPVTAGPDMSQEKTPQGEQQEAVKEKSAKKRGLLDEEEEDAENIEIQAAPEVKEGKPEGEGKKEAGSEVQEGLPGDELILPDGPPLEPKEGAEPQGNAEPKEAQPEASIPGFSDQIHLAANSFESERQEMLRSLGIM